MQKRQENENEKGSSIQSIKSSSNGVPVVLKDLPLSRQSVNIIYDTVVVISLERR
jgi:hypothetical protein